VAELNGLDLDQMMKLVQNAQEDPGSAQPLNAWNARVRRLGGFKGKALIRNHTFVMDEPADLVGKDEAPNSVEYLLGALGGCLTVGFVLNATKRGVSIRNLELTLESSIDNILIFLGLSQEGHSGFKEIAVKAYVDADADEETLQEIWQESIRSSPVGNSLSRAVIIKPAPIRV